MSLERIRFEKATVDFNVDNQLLRVIDDISFSISDGEFISIVGPSGCGKTTLMNIIAGFVRPTSGKVMLDGIEINGPSQNRGVIFQEYGIFPWLTVEKNILFGLTLRNSKVPKDQHQQICSRYLHLMGLADFSKSYPRTLSGGMRQRLAIARAYATNPEFLLMDEPFGALDAQTRAKMQDLLLEVLQQERKTVLLITHSVDEAIYLSSKIIVVTARPAKIKEVIDVPFPYPRHESIHDDPQFISLKSRLRDLVMKEYEAQQKISNI